MSDAAKNLSFDIDSDDSASIDMRFRVHKVEGVIRIYGALVENTAVDLLEDMRSPQMTLDLSGIVSASWAGIVKFHKYLLGFGAAIRLVGVPQHFYRNFRLILGGSEDLRIVDAEVETFDPANLKNPLALRRVNVKLLEKLAIDQGAIITVAPGSQVLGIAEYVCPRYFQGRDAAAPVFLNTWCVENADEAFFWFNLGHAFSSALALYTNLIESARRNIGPSLADLTVLQQGLNESEGLLGITEKAFDGQRLLHEIQKIDQQVLQFNQKSRRLEDICVQSLKELQVACWTKSTINPGAIFDALVPLIDTSTSAGLHAPEVSSIISHLDLAVGANIGVSLIKQMREMVGTPDAAEKIGRIKDFFNIMDMLTEDDIDETVRDVERELTSIKEHLLRVRLHAASIKSAQTLLRHWHDDLQYLHFCIGLVKAGDTPWVELRDGLFQQWRTRELSDEERRVFSFYFPNALSSDENADKVAPTTIVD